MNMLYDFFPRIHLSREFIFLLWRLTIKDIKSLRDFLDIKNTLLRISLIELKKWLPCFHKLKCSFSQRLILILTLNL